MSRAIKLGAFNIVTHPHTWSGYADLFKNALSLRQKIKIHGERFAIMKSAYRERKFSEPIVYGQISTFIQLDPNDWFDFKEGEPLSESEVQEIVIPDGVVPYLKQVSYVFFPKAHFFVYVVADSAVGSMSPRMMMKYLDHLLNDNRIVQETNYDFVDVRAVQSHKTIDLILQELSVEKLEIVIHKPNDTGDEIEKSIEEEMDDQNIDRIKIDNTAAKNNYIEPNDRTTHLMKAALANGTVVATGYDKDDIKRTLHTQDFPVQETYIFEDKKGDTYFDFLLAKASHLKEKFFRRKL